MKTNSEINVLFVNERDCGGGAARATYSILKSVRDMGVGCRMFVQRKSLPDNDIIPISAFVPNNKFWKILDYIALKLKNKIQHARWRPYKYTQDKSYKSDMRGRNLFGALKKLDYDVLHLHWINNRFIKLSDLPQNKPIVWTLHDSWPFCGVCHYFFDCNGFKKQCGSCPELGSIKSDDLSHQCWLQKAKAYKGKNLHIVAPSRWLAECAKQSSLFSNVDVRVIPNSINTNIFRPYRDDEFGKLPEKIKEKRFEKPIVLYGAVNAATDKRKGFSNLLSALQILKQQGKDHFELLVFGANEGDLSINVGADVTFLGFVGNIDELVALYNLADVMVVPSLTENLSCTIMESLSCGTPVVAFNIGGNSDMVEHKKNGYLAKEKNDADLADGIIWCMENSVPAKLSENARQKVLDSFTPEVVGRKYIDLYGAILHKSLM